ncbi:MAG TPA: hypothetical protein VN851_26875 [Thermoanaerobaculia bacterium]|nr:hypothetical protein [Thermoanaerobaculia bacterium]
MRTWRLLPAERSELYSPIGLRLLDFLTGDAPLGKSEAFLDIRDGAAWRPTGIPAVRTLSGVVAYPGLERRADASGPPRRYRVRIAAELYRPLYRASAEGIEFDAFPWNDIHSPRSTPAVPQDVNLVPAPAYPFPPHVPVVRGRVVGPTGKPVVDAEVSAVRERVLSDERGEFALPLPQAPLGGRLNVKAKNQRSGRSGSLQITLPADLGHSQTIVIP